MKKLIVCILLVCIFCACTESNGSIKDNSQLGLYSTSNELIKALPDFPASAQEHFMLGLAYQEEKQNKKALLHFTNSCFSSHRSNTIRLYAHPIYRFTKGFHFKSPFYDDANYKIAELFFSYREFPYVIKFCDNISDNNYGLHLDALRLKIRALTAQKKFAEAIDLIKDALPQTRTDSDRALLLISRASIYEKQKAYRNALKDYLHILSSKADTWQTNLAARRIAKLHFTHNISLSAAQKEILIPSLYTATEYKQAVDVISTVNKPSDTAKLYGLRSHIRLNGTRKLDLKLKIFNTSQNLKTEALYTAAEELKSRNHESAALKYYLQCINAGDETIRRKALYFAGRYYEDRNSQMFTEYFKPLIKNYKTSKEAEHALWLTGRSYIKAGQYAKADTYLSSSLATFPRGLYSDQCRFWRYKIANLKTSTALAEKMSRELVKYNPDSSYTWLHIQNILSKQKFPALKNTFSESLSNNKIDEALYCHTLLFALDKNKNERNDRIEALPEKFTENYHNLLKTIKNSSEQYSSKQWKLLESYYAIGYRDGINRIAPSTEAKILLSSQYNNNFSCLFNLQNLMDSKGIQENITLMPETLVAMILPRPFYACTEKQSDQHNISADILYAVMKAESLFNHRAVSPAGAKGLMQLMPATAGDIARSMEMKSFELTDPCTSITFGASYLSWLKKYFKGNFRYMVAGYNAGAGNVNKWKKRAHYHDPDYFTEFTPFVETRYYILRTGKYLLQYDIWGN
jgi:hypothetical protein